MKKFLIAAMIMTASAGAMAQNVSMQLGQTGYYGSIDLGNLSRPPVIYQQPMVIQQMPQYQNAAPMYMRVPPGHAKKWSKHCAAYNACGRQVYFVQDSWYNNTYAPQYRKSHGGDGYRNRNDGHNDDRGLRLDDRSKAVKYDKHESKHDKHESKHDKHEGKGKDKGGKGHGNGKH